MRPVNNMGYEVRAEGIPACRLWQLALWDIDRCEWIEQQDEFCTVDCTYYFEDFEEGEEEDVQTESQAGKEGLQRA